MVQLPLLVHSCTMLGGAIPIPNGYFVNQSFVNYPFVHPSGTMRAMLSSPPVYGLYDSLCKAPTSIEVKSSLANEIETIYYIEEIKL